MFSIKQTIFNPNHKSSRYFDFLIQALIIISILSFSIETIPDLNSQQKTILNFVEWFTVSIFTTEYIFRIIISPQKLKFIFSFFGVVDLLAVLPFYLSMGIDLRSIRIVRLFRLVRLFKLARYGKAIKRLEEAFTSIKTELIIFLIVTLFLLYISAVGIYYFEGEAQPKQFGSVFHCLWWATITLTTVGYGDAFPVTVGGKIFTFIVLIVGLGVIAIPTGLVASAFTKVLQNEKDGSK